MLYRKSNHFASVGKMVCFREVTKMITIGNGGQRSMTRLCIDTLCMLPYCPKWRSKKPEIAFAPRGLLCCTDKETGNYRGPHFFLLERDGKLGGGRLKESEKGYHKIFISVALMIKGLGASVLKVMRHYLADIPHSK